MKHNVFLLDQLQSKPFIGCFGAILGGITPFFDSVTPWLQVLSLILGFTVGIITLFLKAWELVDKIEEKLKNRNAKKTDLP